jgi:hypothetical protein
MENSTQSGQPPVGNFRDLLAQRAAKAAAQQAEAVGAATAHFRDEEQAALDGLAKIAQEMHGAPVPSPDTLGPLWPGNQQKS